MARRNSSGSSSSQTSVPVHPSGERNEALPPRTGNQTAAISAEPASCGRFSPVARLTELVRLLGRQAATEATERRGDEEHPNQQGPSS
jgi:hypothetical protein